jgi:hypothetical protein
VGQKRIIFPRDEAIFVGRGVVGVKKSRVGWWKMGFWGWDRAPAVYPLKNTENIERIKRNLVEVFVFWVIPVFLSQIVSKMIGDRF